MILSKRTYPSSNGFTLIELLIVISIIALLSAAGLVAYGNFMKNSRDARRQSDLKIIQSALEDYHSDLIFYPTDDINTILSSGGSFTSNTGLGSHTPPAPLKTYLNAMPKDPLTSTTTPYCYVTTANCDNSNSTDKRCATYTLYAKLENPPSGSTFTCDGKEYDLKVTPP